MSATTRCPHCDKVVLFVDGHIALHLVGDATCPVRADVVRHEGTDPDIDPPGTFVMVRNDAMVARDDAGNMHVMVPRGVLDANRDDGTAFTTVTDLLALNDAMRENFAPVLAAGAVPPESLAALTPDEQANAAALAANPDVVAAFYREMLTANAGVVLGIVRGAETPAPAVVSVAPASPESGPPVPPLDRPA